MTKEQGTSTGGDSGFVEELGVRGYEAQAIDHGVRALFGGKEPKYPASIRSVKLEQQEGGLFVGEFYTQNPSGEGRDRNILAVVINPETKSPEAVIVKTLDISSQK